MLIKDSIFTSEDSLVEFVCGSLAGLQGKVIRRGEQLRLVVEVELLQRGVSVEIDSHMVQPLRIDRESGSQRENEGLPRFLRLFSYILSHKVRDRIFEPAFQEILGDFLVAPGTYQTKWPRRWLNFCFTFRTVLMIFECLRATITDQALYSITRLAPEPIKKWWLSM
jgi:hypothetical protein